MEFNDLTGRRFKMWFTDYYSLVNKVNISEARVHFIEGYVENFCPTKEVVLTDNVYGFNVIPYKSILYMLEVPVKN